MIVFCMSSDIGFLPARMCPTDDIKPIEKIGGMTKESLSVVWIGSILLRPEFLYIWAGIYGWIRQFLRRSVLIYVIEWIELVFLALLFKVCALYMIRMDELFTSVIRKTLD
jgi:hypothetical protein